MIKAGLLPSFFAVAFCTVGTELAGVIIRVTGDAGLTGQIRKDKLMFHMCRRLCKMIGGCRVTVTTMKNHMSVAKLEARRVMIKSNKLIELFGRMAVATGHVRKLGTELRGVFIFMTVNTEFLFKGWKVKNLLFINHVTIITGHAGVLAGEHKAGCFVVKVLLRLIAFPTVSDVTDRALLCEECL